MSSDLAIDSQMVPKNTNYKEKINKSDLIKTKNFVLPRTLSRK